MSASDPKRYSAATNENTFLQAARDEDLPSAIYRDELNAIRDRRAYQNKLPDKTTELDVPDEPGPDVRPSVEHGLNGLAISGGGIRSATFSTGVMQALAGADVLKHIDYLSTVSGGGYSGSSLTWALYGKTKKEAEEAFIASFGVGPDSFPVGTDDPGAPRPEKTDAHHGKRLRLLKYLREHGKYLMPGGGITGLSCLAVFVRGVLLNLVVWIGLVGTLIFTALTQLDDGPAVFRSMTPSLWLGVLGVAIAIVYGLGTWLASFWSQVATRYGFRRFIERGANPYFALLALALVIGTLGWVYDAVHKHVNELSPAMILSGAASGVWTYMKSASGKKSKIPITLVATVGSLLLIYGGLLGSYALAVQAETAGLSDHWWQFLLVVGALGWLANTNYIALHRFYRDRLMETFLPGIENAIRDKTGPSREADTAKISEMWDKARARGPYHIVNTNLILVDSHRRTQRTRGGDNFILAPFYCGSRSTGWRRTEKFEQNQMTLATAMAISAAAANPNAGVAGAGITRNKFVSLLMGLLNLRLGYWVRNPNKPRWWGNPPNHFWPGGAYELSGGFKETSKWLQLSDGGHFENLALYEMIRRQLKVIVVIDGGADPEFNFADLQTAARRIGADFGARIEFGEKDEDKPGALAYPRDYEKGSFPAHSGRVKRGFLHAKIKYAGETAGAPGPDGDLIYIKTTLVEDLSVETNGYKDAHPTFPDETTADQFFDPDQFEAYRDLGYKIGADAVSAIRGLVEANPSTPAPASES